jgi:hypothetical protein
MWAPETWIDHAAMSSYRDPHLSRMSRLLTIRDRNELVERISMDPGVCFGPPVILATRVWLSLIVDNLAEGIPEAELLAA